MPPPKQRCRRCSRRSAESSCSAKWPRFGRAFLGWLEVPRWRRRFFGRSWKSSYESSSSSARITCAARRACTPTRSSRMTTCIRSTASG
eukprot:2982822-Pyramimonas_sp.AAC.1